MGRPGELLDKQGSKRAAEFPQLDRLAHGADDRPALRIEEAQKRLLGNDLAGRMASLRTVLVRTRELEKLVDVGPMLAF